MGQLPNLLKPYLRATYISGNHDGYTDRGPTPMSVSANGTDNLMTELGVRCKTRLGNRFSAEVKAGLQREWLDNTVSVNTLVVGDRQRAESPDADELALVLGVRTQMDINDDMSLSVGYEPVISDNWYNHALDIVLSYTF